MLHFESIVTFCGVTRITWDTTVYTGKKLNHNRPDITLVRKDTQEWTLINIAVPADQNIISTEEGNVDRYQDLVFQNTGMGRNLYPSNSTLRCQSDFSGNKVIIIIIIIVRFSPVLLGLLLPAAWRHSTFLNTWAVPRMVDNCVLPTIRVWSTKADMVCCTPYSTGEQHTTSTLVDQTRIQLPRQRRKNSFFFKTGLPVYF